MAIDRRTLIRSTCATAAAFASKPAWAAGGIFRERGAALRASTDTVLVIVNINGGNDGLNTVVPFNDSVYRTARPHIALTGSQLLPIDTQTGLHPSLANFHRYLDSGKLAIVQNVGYPKPDMSHFRSDDIWEKAVLEPEAEPTGWLGRALDSLYKNDTENIHSISVSGYPPAFFSDLVTTPVVSDPGSFNYPQDPPKTDSLRTMFQPTGRANRDYVAHIAQMTLADTEAVQAAVTSYQSTIVYPDTGFAHGMQLAASLIASDIGPRIFYISQGGYDTHSNQLGDHESLLKELDTALDAFYRDLVEHGHDQRVVIMTYSEFGRRVEDNGSGGTDHGSSAPLFVLGSRVKGGLYGAPPSLTDLDSDGNLKFAIDFRQVYASVLANWMGADPAEILFGNYPTISFL